MMVTSDTGPLISICQSDSMDLIVTLFGGIHTSTTCQQELVRHGWGEAIAQMGPTFVVHTLTDHEVVQAQLLAQRIATHAASKDPEPSNHLGEAEVMVLVQRPEFAVSVLLLDELAARGVASELNLNISGFAGILLLAVSAGLLTADGVKERLERCRLQGTHYSLAFIERVYTSAKQSERNGTSENGT